MTTKETLLLIALIGVVIFAVILHTHQSDRQAMKTVSFWAGFLAVWIFWSALICALINNEIEINELRQDIDRTDNKLKDFLNQE